MIFQTEMHLVSALYRQIRSVCVGVCVCVCVCGRVWECVRKKINDPLDKWKKNTFHLNKKNEQIDFEVGLKIYYRET